MSALIARPNLWLPPWLAMSRGIKRSAHRAGCRDSSTGGGVRCCPSYYPLRYCNGGALSGKYLTAPSAFVQKDDVRYKYTAIDGFTTTDQSANLLTGYASKDRCVDCFRCAALSTNSYLLSFSGVSFPSCYFDFILGWFRLNGDPNGDYTVPMTVGNQTSPQVSSVYCRGQVDTGTTQDFFASAACTGSPDATRAVYARLDLQAGSSGHEVVLSPYSLSGAGTPLGVAVFQADIPADTDCETSFTVSNAIVANGGSCTVTAIPPIPA